MPDPLISLGHDPEGLYSVFVQINTILTSGLTYGLILKQWNICSSSLFIYLKSQFSRVAESRRFIIGWLSVFFCISLCVMISPFWTTFFDINLSESRSLTRIFEEERPHSIFIKWKIIIFNFINFTNSD